MICSFLMSRLFHFNINPCLVDHPFLKHKVHNSSPALVCTLASKKNVSLEVPDAIPSEGWLTFKEFLVKAFLIGLIYICLILIYKFSRDFLFWSDNPRRKVRKTIESHRCAERLIHVLNLIVTPSNLAEYERNESHFSCSGVKARDTRSVPHGVLIMK